VRPWRVHHPQVRRVHQRPHPTVIRCRVVAIAVDWPRVELITMTDQKKTDTRTVLSDVFRHLVAHQRQ